MPFQDCDNNLDCNYAGCDDGNGDPDWDSVVGQSAGDPVLAIDDTQGFGPEVVVVEAPVAGTYGIAVDGFRTDVLSNATVRLWLGGQLAGSVTAPVSNHQLLPTLRLTIDEAGTACVDAFDDTDITCVAFPTCTPNAASDPDEQVEVPGSATDTIDYIAVARLAGATGGIVGQKYTIEVQTFDNSQCIASEPNGGDDVFSNGRCVGNFTELVPPDLQCTNDAARIAEPMLTADLALCGAAPEGSIPGCGRMCGNGDSDWFRVGVLNNDQILHAVLDYNPLDGELGLARGTLTASTGAVVETPSKDTDHDGHLELSFAAPRNAPKEYGIRVKPVGTTGHQVQLYSLNLEVGAECIEDAFDLGALVNEKPVNAVIIRPGAVESSPLNFNSTGLSRCTNDVDVFEFIAFQGENITVELDQVDTSPGGLIVELGTRPADLNNPAVSVGSAVAGAAPIAFANATGQQLYVTVKAPAGTVVTGPYTLRITAD